MSSAALTHSVSEDPEREAQAGSGRLAASSHRFLGFIFVATGVAVAVQTVVHVVDAKAFNGEYWGLSADVDGNSFSWASSVATFSVALGLAALAALLPQGRRTHLLVAGIVAFFSLDDIVAIHELIDTSILDAENNPVGRLIWPLFFLPLFAVVAVALWRLSGVAAGRGRLAIRLGLGLLVLAIGLETSSSLYYEEGGSTISWPDAIEVALEEGAELGGWMLLAGGVSVLAVSAVLLWGAEATNGPARRLRRGS